MTNARLKLFSRVCLGVSALIFVVYLLDRVSASALVPVDLYAVPSLDMFALVLVMSALVGASFMAENHLADE